MAKMTMYPETVQYRQMVEDVVHRRCKFLKVKKSLPILTFIGTVKLHGVNAAIGYQRDVGHWYQSRNRIVTIDQDNYAFAHHIDRLANTFFTDHVLFESLTIRKHYEQGDRVIIYGEWCGGDIQQNVALHSLLPMFVIFKIRIIPLNSHGLATVSKNPAFWLEPTEWSNIKWHECSIYNIYNFPTYEILIDLNEPQLSEETLTMITEEVERRCPVAAHFNVIGTGEGVVWTEWENSQGELNFKVKGRSHLSSRNNCLVSIAPMKFKTTEEFLHYACTENRMKQALEYMQEDRISIEVRNIDAFLRWLTEDIIKEEKDAMTISGIDAKQISRLIRNETEGWFIKSIAENRKMQQYQKKQKNNRRSDN